MNARTNAGNWHLARACPIEARTRAGCERLLPNYIVGNYRVQLENLVLADEGRHQFVAIG